MGEIWNAHKIGRKSEGKKKYIWKTWAYMRITMNSIDNPWGLDSSSAGEAPVVSFWGQCNETSSSI